MISRNNTFKSERSKRLQNL